MPTGVASRFDGMTVEQKNGHTVLSGSVANQMDLYHILGRLRELELPLVSVNRAEPDLEEVFVHLLNASAERRED